MATIISTPVQPPVGIMKPSSRTMAEVRSTQEYLMSSINDAQYRASRETIPIIDLGPSYDGTLASKQAVAAQIRAACLHTGFFQIVNHSVGAGERAGVLEQARRFFHELSPAKKQALHMEQSTLFRGWEPSGYTNVNPDDWKDGEGDGKETKEGFNWGYEEAMDLTGGDGKYVEMDGSKPPKEGANLWPEEQDLPGFYSSIKAYYGEVSQVAFMDYEIEISTLKDIVAYCACTGPSAVPSSLPAVRPLSRP